MPKSRTEFWSNKFAQNIKRDKASEYELTKRGWQTIVVWECETKKLEELWKKLSEALEEVKQAKGTRLGARR
jgi:DNA mismatch endonuclease (patch repair protein)